MSARDQRRRPAQVGIKEVKCGTVDERIREAFKKTGSQDGKGAEATCIVKFFDPTGSWTWNATEFDGKDTFFGLVDGFELGVGRLLAI